MTTRPVAVAGVGQTSFGQSEDGLRELGSEAVRRAIRDSPFGPSDIDAAYVGNLGGPGDPQRSLVGQYCLREIGLTGISIINVENACSSSACALREAYRAVRAGFEETVIVLGVEKMTGISTGEATDGLGNSSDVERENRRGFTFPSLYALKTVAYRERYGVDRLRDALSAISVKNHRNALANPYAQFHKEITPSEVLESPVVAEPLRLYDFCPTSDGGAAVILTIDKSVMASMDPCIVIESSVHRTGDFDNPHQLEDVSDIVETARIAYERAGVAVGEIDLFEIHDAATIGELTRCEAVGLCEPGTGSEFVLDGNTAIDGPHPVNPSGGLKARGHPVGATGIAQINELVWQFRGEAGDRQVDEPTVGLALNTGGALSGVTANHTIHILRSKR